MQTQSILSLLATLLVVNGTAFAAGRSVDQTTKPWLVRDAVKSVKQSQAVPGGSAIAMSCPKCKTASVLVKRDIGTKPGHGQKEVTVAVHQCPGCSDQMVRKWASKQMEWVHTCKDCGSQSASCCATMASAKESTKGMESIAVR